MPHGLLIAFEGIPGSPARKHLDAFSAYLTTLSVPHQCVHFLDASSPIGALALIARNDIFSSFNANTTQLLLDAERFSRIEFINELLESGVHVLIDRYLLCSLAEAHAQHVRSSCKSIHEFPKQDILFYFEYTPEETILQIPYSLYASLEHLHRLHEAYEEIIDYYECFEDVLLYLSKTNTFNETQDILRRRYHLMAPSHLQAK